MKCVNTAERRPGSPGGKVTKMDQRPEYLLGLRVQQLSYGASYGSSEEVIFTCRRQSVNLTLARGKFRSAVFFYEVDVIIFWV